MKYYVIICLVLLSKPSHAAEVTLDKSDISFVESQECIKAFLYATAQYPLELAMKEHDLHMMYRLIRCHVNINAHNDDGYNALNQACLVYNDRIGLPKSIYLLLLFGSHFQQPALDFWPLIRQQRDAELLFHELPPGSVSAYRRASVRAQCKTTIKRILGYAIGRAQPAHVRHLLEYADIYAPFFCEFPDLTPITLIQYILERTDLKLEELNAYKTIQEYIAQALAVHLRIIYSRILVNLKRLYRLPDKALHIIIEKLLDGYSDSFVGDTLRWFRREQKLEGQRIFSQEYLRQLQASPTSIEGFHRMRDAMRLENIDAVRRLIPVVDDAYLIELHFEAVHQHIPSIQATIISRTLFTALLNRESFASMFTHAIHQGDSSFICFLVDYIIDVKKHEDPWIKARSSMCQGRPLLQAVCDEDEHLLKKCLPFQNPTPTQLREIRKKFTDEIHHLTWALGFALQQAHRPMVHRLLKYADPYAPFCSQYIELTPIRLIQDMVAQPHYKEQLAYNNVQAEIAHKIALDLCTIYSRVLLNLQRAHALPDDVLPEIIQQMVSGYSQSLAQQILQYFFIEQQQEDQRIFTPERLHMLTQPAYEPGPVVQFLGKVAGVFEKKAIPEASFTERFYRLRDAIRLHNLGWVKHLLPLLNMSTQLASLGAHVALKDLLDEAQKARALATKTELEKATTILARVQEAYYTYKTP